MRLDGSKDICVHVSTCTDYDFNALTPVVCSCDADKTGSHVSSQKMSDKF
jgi:hypothetical protein